MCKYCEGEYKESIMDNGDDSIRLDNKCDNLLDIYFMNELDYPIDTSVEINYCPMCGRKLR